SYDTYFPESIQTDSNNNLYIGGEIQFDDGHNFDDNVFVLKTDERGRALQLVEYGKLDRPEYVEELTVFDDASYFFGGFTDYLDSDGYLVKADQSGDSNCDQSYHEVESVYYPYTVQAKTSKSYHVHILTSEPEVENVAAESDPMLCQAESRGRTTKLEDTNLLTTEHQLLVDKPSAAIMIYPNPNQGSFQVNLPVEKSFERAALYNSKGQLVKQLNTKELQGVLHFENYAKGVYYLKISDVQRTESHKIVVH
ncbi:MAG: T9SS type A sorting domain-containing protein, partial [Bacteroidota bacterium]